MSKPIPATPTLRGKDAVRFVKEMDKVNRGIISPQQKRMAERIKKNAKAYGKLLGNSGVIRHKSFKLKQNKATEIKTKAYMRGWQNGFNKATQDEMKTERIWIGWLGIFLIFSMMALALMSWYFDKQLSSDLAYLHGFFTASGLFFLAKGLE